MNVLRTASLGLTSMEHWYGLPEALFEGRVIQDYPVDYNYMNEAHRFGEAGRLWKQAAPPFSDHWNMVMDSLLSMDFTIDPTLFRIWPVGIFRRKAGKSGIPSIRCRPFGTFIVRAGQPTGRIGSTDDRKRDGLEGEL